MAVEFKILSWKKNFTLKSNFSSEVLFYGIILILEWIKFIFIIYSLTKLWEKLALQGMVDNIEFLFEVVELWRKKIIEKAFQFFKVIIFIFK